VETKKNTNENTCEDPKKHLKTAALRAYNGQKKKTIDHNEIVRLMPMVSKIAQKVTAYLKPPLSFEDLVSAGTIGLLKAAQNYDPSHNAEFTTYAYIKIKGAVIDELRNLSLLPPNLNKQISEATNAARKITEKTGSPPDDLELADKLGVSTEQLHKIFKNARAKNFLSLDNKENNNARLRDFIPSENAVNPEKKLEHNELIEKLADAIEKLPKKLKQIIILYYQQQLTMKQVAEVFDITESRVSQLHANALFSLSVKLREWNDGG